MIVDGHDPAPPSPVTLTRHEERLQVALETVPTERVRLERVVVTEQRTLTVEVSREEIRLTREPLSGPSPSVPQASRPPEPIVVILHEERVEIVKTVVPVERVTLVVDTVTGEQQVVQAVAKERIDVEEQDAAGRVVDRGP